MTEKYISEVRAFNRFYTAFIGLLNNSFLNTKYSLPESRVLHAIYLTPGLAHSEIISMLNIDKSYLSRILLTLEKRKVITKKKSTNDGRAINLYITDFGKKEFEKLDEAANKLVRNLLSSLSDKDCAILVKSMTQIQETLSKSKSSKKF